MCDSLYENDWQAGLVFSIKRHWSPNKFTGPNIFSSSCDTYHITCCVKNHTFSLIYVELSENI